MVQFPDITAADGIWTLKKVRRAILGDNWPFPPPTAPDTVTAVGGTAQATVTFSGQVTYGDSPTFTVTSSPGGITATGSSPVTVTGLTNGTEYTFTVTVTDNGGQTATSSASNAVTPVAPPRTINQSLRFNDNDSAYLSRTFSSGNRKTWTWSGWVKRGNIGSTWYHLMHTASGVDTRLRFQNGDKLEFFIAGTATHILTTSLFQDSSDWYHVVFAFDSTQATASDRAKLYVNGQHITALDQAVYPSQNYDSGFNTAGVHALGALTTAGEPFDGYMAEVHFIDGTAYGATAFGTFDNGVWVAIDPSVTYGTNGFYLDFADSAAIGDDESGNTNDFTPNNFTANDVVLDSPTTNFTTWNSSQSELELFEGNTRAFRTASGGEKHQAWSTKGVSSGKWYFEIFSNNTRSVSLQRTIVGVGTDPAGSIAGNYFLGEKSYEWAYFYSSGALRNNNVDTSTGSGVAYQDIVQIAIDMDAGRIWFGKNNTWVLSGNPSTGANPNYSNLSGTVYICGSRSTLSTGYGIDAILNAGQDSSFAGRATAQGNSDANGVGDFYYAPPTGFLAICDANLNA